MGPIKNAIIRINSNHKTTISNLMGHQKKRRKEKKTKAGRIKKMKILTELNDHKITTTTAMNTKRRDKL